MELFSQLTALSALAVVVIQQILKLNIVPSQLANKYPIITNILLSIGASVYVQYETALQLVGLWEWIAYVGTVSVVAALTYNNTVKNSVAMKRLTNKMEVTDVTYREGEQNNIA